MEDAKTLSFHAPISISKTALYANGCKLSHLSLIIAFQTKAIFTTRYAVQPLSLTTKK